MMDGLERNFTAKRDDFNFPICDLFHFYEPNSSSTFLVVKLISSFRSKSNSMGVTSRAGTCFPLGAPDFTSVLLVGFTASVYPFRTFKLFKNQLGHFIGICRIIQRLSLFSWLIRYIIWPQSGIAIHIMMKYESICLCESVMDGFKDISNIVSSCNQY